jgi:rhodanese-related sulfurtransferase
MVNTNLRAGALAFLLVFAFALTGCASSNGPEPPSTSAASGTPKPPTAGYVRDLPPADFHDYLQQRGDAFIVDTRQAVEWNDGFGHLDNAVQIPLEDLETRLGDLPTDKNRPIIVYDQLDVRSATAAHRIAALGYREVVTMQGGLAAYRHAGF